MGHSGAITGLVASIIALLAMGIAVAQDATWKDCELAARDPDRSIAACSKILKRASSKAHAAAFHYRGQAYAAKGNLDQAISDISAAIRLDPERTYRWQERGELYARQGKYQQAVADITEAIRIDSTPRAFRFQSRADAYQSLGDLTRAIADYDEAIRLDSEPRSFRFSARANALRDAGRYDRALADYETALKLAPTNAWILVDRGRTYARMGRSEAAKNDFNSALRLDPANEERLRPVIEMEVAALPGRSAPPPQPLQPQQPAAAPAGAAGVNSPARQNAASAASRPTFNCGNARSPLALLICSGEETAQADWDLKIAYWARYFSLDKDERTTFWEDQDKWLKTLDEKCQLSTPPFSRQQTSCVIDAYKERAALHRSKLRGAALAESKMTREQLAQIQQALIELGFFNDEADGAFGPLTRAAIRKFQEANGFLRSDFLSVEQKRVLLEPAQQSPLPQQSPLAQQSPQPEQLPQPQQSPPAQPPPTIDATAESAKKGDASAQIEMGNRYASGQKVSKDETQAASWYRKAAEQGDANAQYDLARMYFEGRGVSQSDAEAIQWYRKSAEQDNVDAMYALGLMYDYGRGSEKNGEKAVEWLQKAAAQGSQAAKDRLGERAAILARLRSTREIIATRMGLLLTETDRARIEESSARLAAANDRTALVDLKSLQAEADDVGRTFGEAEEFASVSEIAAKRIAMIQGELKEITSDAPVVLRLQAAIDAVKAARAGSHLRVLQSSLGELNATFDGSRPQLDKLKFYQP